MVTKSEWYVLLTYVNPTHYLLVKTLFNSTSNLQAVNTVNNLKSKLTPVLQVLIFHTLQDYYFIYQLFIQHSLKIIHKNTW